MLSKDTIIAYIDGGSRGNPGPAGYGVHIETGSGTTVEELREGLGVVTNNVAEYRGLLAALSWAIDHGHRRLHIRSDSQLLVRQMRGEYRVKNPGLQVLHRDARELAGRFDRVSFEHIPRSQNEAADRLANLAMDEAARPARAPRASAHGGAAPAIDVPRSARTSLVQHPDPAPVAPQRSETRPPVPPSASRAPIVPGQAGLPFDDQLPDNATHSAHPSRPIKK